MGCAENFGEAQSLDAFFARARHFDQRELSLQWVAGCCQIVHAMHGDHAIELIFDLCQHHRGAFGGDSDARQMLFVLGLGDSEAVDIVAAAGK